MPPEVAFADLQFIIEFVYRGEIDVSEAELQVSTIESIFQCVDLEKRYIREGKHLAVNESDMLNCC